MKITNTKIILVAVVVLAVLACVFAVWKLHANAPATLANIPTPTGWYSWGETKLPLGGSTPTTVIITFGNQPMDNNGNNSTTLIVVTARNASGKTEQQWIDTEVEPMLASLGSTTSTQSWNVMNGRRVLEAKTMTPAGSYNLTNFLFDNGIEYSFNLAPSFLAPEYNAKDLASSSDAQVLRSMVQQFVQSFPSSVSQ
jgi:hypothetical protein